MTTTPSSSSLDLYSQARHELAENGVCILRGVIPLSQVRQLRLSLEEVFARSAHSQQTVGARTNMTEAAHRLRQDGRGAAVLNSRGLPADSEPAETADTTHGNGQYLTEIEVGRWHPGVRQFEHSSALPQAVAHTLGEKKHLHFYMDHMFLKEAGSQLSTAWHQDAPYFPFDCSSTDPVQVAVCWVPVDAVAANSGGMHYIKGSHRWQEYAPNTLITNDAIDPDSATPCLPNIEEGIAQGRYEAIQFTNVQPGDVIIHHPNTVHGSYGNRSKLQRRLAASLRYVGSDVAWCHKKTNPKGHQLKQQWSMARDTGLLTMAALMVRRILYSCNWMKDEDFYKEAHVWAPKEMQDGVTLGATAVGRVAFPVVWRCGEEGVRSKL